MLDNNLVDIKETVGMTNNKHTVSVTKDGTIETSINLKDDYQYVAMLLNEGTQMKLDAYITKSNNSLDCKVSIGNFPIKDDSSNALTEEQVNRLISVANGYDVNINYQNELSMKEPPLAKLNEIFFKEAKEEGIIKIGINNKDGIYHIGVSFSKEYHSLTDAFIENKVVVDIDNNQNEIVKITGDRMNQFSVLCSVQSTLIRNRETTNNFQYIKKEPSINNEAARVNHYFLIATLVADLLLLGFYFLVLR